jgi:hypothetical protein
VLVNQERRHSMKRERDTPKLAYNEGRYEDAREMLLKEYSRKPVRRLIQVDCLTGMYGDTAVGHDEDGHTIMGGETYELKNMGDVRVLIPEGADKEQVLAVLAKAYAYLSEDWELLTNPAALKDEFVNDPDEPRVDGEVPF